LDDGSHRVITIDPAGNINTIASTSDGLFKAFTGVPSINDSGKVLFLAQDASNSKVGLFTGPSPTSDRVLEAGDPFLGSTVSSLFILNEGLNNSGQIVFRATL